MQPKLVLHGDQNDVVPMADLEIVTDPEQSSREAGLRYVTDAKPGIRRKKRGKSFQYFDTDGSALRT
jgi:DNA topoisomerase-1